MKRKLVLILIVILNSVLIHSQSVKLESHIVNDSVNFKVNITNDLNQSFVFYRPNSSDLCTGILNFLFKDSEGQLKEFYPCEELSQVDSIQLTSRNSIELGKGESFSFDMRFIIPAYLLESKFVRCQIDYSDIDFILELNYEENIIFRDILLSSFVEIRD